MTFHPRYATASTAGASLNAVSLRASLTTLLVRLSEAAEAQLLVRHQLISSDLAHHQLLSTDLAHGERAEALFDAAGLRA